MLSTIYPVVQYQLPEYVNVNSVYEVVGGSVSYGANIEDIRKKSDFDLITVFMPPKSILFPHLSGKLWGFDQYDEPNTYQIPRILYEKIIVDLTSYPITKYFRLAQQGNPNIIDTLFVTFDNVRVCGTIGNIIRDNRHLFLSKVVFEKFRGYAVSQLFKIRVVINDQEKSLGNFYREIKKDSLISKRFEINESGIDWKFVYHVVRLLLECEQILEVGDLDLRANSYLLKEIRMGVYSLGWLMNFFIEKEKRLEELMNTTTLRATVDKTKVREVLFNCIEHHYGNISDIVYKPQTDNDWKIEKIKEILNG